MVELHDSLEKLVNLLDYYVLDREKNSVKRFSVKSMKLPKRIMNAISFNIPQGTEQYSMHYKIITLGFDSKSDRNSFASGLESDLISVLGYGASAAFPNLENLRLYSHMALGYFIDENERPGQKNYYLTLHVIVPAYVNQEGFGLTDAQFKRLDNLRNLKPERHVDIGYLAKITDFMKVYEKKNGTRFEGNILVLPPDFGYSRYSTGYVISSDLSEKNAIAIPLKRNDLSSFFNKLAETGKIAGSKVSAILYSNMDQLDAMSAAGTLINQHAKYNTWHTDSGNIVIF